MNAPDPSERPPRPETTSLGGGHSAKLVALVTVGVLGVVAWIGWSGRGAVTPPSAAETASPRSVAEIATPTQPPPSPTVAPVRTPMPLTDDFRSGPSGPLGDDAFGIVTVIGGRLYMDVLEEPEPGRLHGAFRLPFPEPTGEETFELVQLWTREQRRSFVSLGSWSLPLRPLVAGTGQAGTVVDITVPAQPHEPNVPRLIRHGYRLKIRAESRFEFGAIVIDIRFGPERQPWEESDRYPGPINPFEGPDPDFLYLYRDGSGEPVSGASTLKPRSAHVGS